MDRIKNRTEYNSLHEEAVYLLRLAEKVIEQECGSGGSALATAIDEFFEEYDHEPPKKKTKEAEEEVEQTQSIDDFM